MTCRFRKSSFVWWDKVPINTTLFYLHVNVGNLNIMRITKFQTFYALLLHSLVCNEMGVWSVKCCHTMIIASRELYGLTNGTLSCDNIYVQTIHFMYFGFWRSDVTMVELVCMCIHQDHHVCCFLMNTSSTLRQYCEGNEHTPHLRHKQRDSM